MEQFFTGKYWFVKPKCVVRMLWSPLTSVKVKTLNKLSCFPPRFLGSFLGMLGLESHSWLVSSPQASSRSSGWSVLRSPESCWFGGATSWCYFLNSWGYLWFGKYSPDLLIAFILWSCLLFFFSSPLPLLEFPSLLVFFHSVRCKTDGWINFSFLSMSVFSLLRFRFPALLEGKVDIKNNLSQLITSVLIFSFAYPLTMRSIS